MASVHARVKLVVTRPSVPSAVAVAVAVWRPSSDPPVSHTDFGVAEMRGPRGSTRTRLVDGGAKASARTPTSSSAQIRPIREGRIPVSVWRPRSDPP